MNAAGKISQPVSDGDFHPFLWEHTLRSPSLVMWAVVVLMIELSQILLCFPILIHALIEFGENHIRDGLISSGILIGLILLSIYNYQKYIRHLLRMLTTNYAITNTRIFFQYGWPATRKSISIDQIIVIRRIEDNDKGLSSLLLTTDPPSDIRGFDFEKHQHRKVASLERVPDHEHIVKLITQLKGSSPRLDLTKRNQRDRIPKTGSSLFIFITKYVGSLYSILNIVAFSYVVDVFVLPGNIIEDKITSTTRLKPQLVYNESVLQRTSKGYTFATDTKLFQDHQALSLEVSPIYRVVTDIWLHDVPLKGLLVTRLQSGNLYVYLFTFFFLFVVAGIISECGGRISADMIPMIYLIPIVLIIWSVSRWMSFFPPG